MAWSLHPLMGRRRTRAWGRWLVGWRRIRRGCWRVQMAKCGGNGSAKFLPRGLFVSITPGSIAAEARRGATRSVRGPCGGRRTSACVPRSGRAFEFASGGSRGGDSRR